MILIAYSNEKELSKNLDSPYQEYIFILSLFVIFQLIKILIEPVSASLKIPTFHPILPSSEN